MRLDLPDCKALKTLSETPSGKRTKDRPNLRDAGRKSIDSRLTND